MKGYLDQALIQCKDSTLSFLTLFSCPIAPLNFLAISGRGFSGLLYTKKHVSIPSRMDARNNEKETSTTGRSDSFFAAKLEKNTRLTNVKTTVADNAGRRVWCSRA